MKVKQFILVCLLGIVFFMGFGTAALYPETTLGTPITSVPYVISTAGVYYLDSDLTYSSSGKYRDNIAVGCITSYSGGTNIGNNN